MSILVEKNYSKCPLKKRPVNYTFDETNDASDDVIVVTDEPQNLSIKRECKSVDIVKSIESKLPSSPINNIYSSEKTSSVIVPTPTYPNLNLQPWNFHIPFTTDFYRNIHHSHQQISPLRGDLHSPNSPSEGSISPPPHYLKGRSSSVSPPIREVHRPVVIKPTNSSHHIIKPEAISQHRYLPYHIPYHQPYILGLSQSPVSPSSYSDSSSHYSIRSHTPESIVSTPEDLSIKNPLPTSNYSLTASSPYSPVSPLSVSLSSPESPSSLSSSQDQREKSKTFSTSYKEKNTPPRYQCPDCNKSYSTYSGLTKHQQFHCPAAEGNQAKKSFSCKDCDKTYVSLGALKMHIRTHTLPCKCTICGKAFSRPWLLQGHIRTHTGEKPFRCQHCHRAFADRSNLRAHLQTHSDIKKYSCNTCSKTFSRMSLLTKHSEGGCPGNQAITNISLSSSPYLS